MDVKRVPDVQFKQGITCMLARSLVRWIRKTKDVRIGKAIRGTSQDKSGLL